MDSFEKQWQRWFPEDSDSQSSIRAPGGWLIRIVIIIASILVVFILFSIGKSFYSEWLWFDSLGFSSVYTTILGAKILIFLTAAVIFGVFFMGNLILATRLAPRNQARFWPWTVIRQLQPMLKWSIILGSLLLSLIFGMVAQDNWMGILRFFNAQPFGITDPVFHKEIGFYVFSLPFLHLLRGWLLSLLIVTTLGSAAIYVISYASQRLRFDFHRPLLIHISGLTVAILGLFAWGYWLGIWELVFSSRGVVFGASYADMHAKLPAQWILLSVVIVVIVVTLLSLWRHNFRWLLYGIGGWIIAAIIIGGIYPSLVQRFQVQPNELAKETPYIEYNIEFTREAFGLDDIDELPFPAEDTPSLEDIIANDATINNVRLWDTRPLKDTYNQIQSFRLYYDFNDVDVDRYEIDGNYRQVMLSARELSAEKLTGEAQTWVNRRLQFTHGYGLALSPVNEVTTQGLPELLIKDIPPVGDFNIDRPQIYYGEKTNDYVIVKTNTEEFDYPKGDVNVYGNYEGTGGVSLSGFIRRLVYAWQFGDVNILISGELTPESRILYHRNVQQRVNQLAPFLSLDRDPYLVVMDGGLFWIQDAYTTSDRYPYSEPVNGINYIRNSVKVVIDAYNGNVTLYVIDPEDALIRTYQSIFPDLFTPIEEMPDSALVHLRYPEDMFYIQSSVYQTYHMMDVRVFYNKEDLWTIPREVYHDIEQPLEPYYIIMRLPTEETEEFLLMLPFTPVSKNVTIGWLAARCDGQNYGKLLSYLFPKERTVYGPSQIENRIGQDTVITEQLALWGRGGSDVIRGNLLLIPLADSMLYVEPVFLEAETGGLPELKRVIVVAGEQIAMEASLQESISTIFGSDLQPTPPDTGPPVIPDDGEPEEPVDSDIAYLVDKAQQHYNQALEYLSDGDWAAFGEEWEALKTTLDELAVLVTED